MKVRTLLNWHIYSITCDNYNIIKNISNLPETLHKIFEVVDYESEIKIMKNIMAWSNIKINTPVVDNALIVLHILELKYWK